MNKYNRGAFFSIAESLCKMCFQLVMMILLSRYLGPEKLGLFFYCVALVVVFAFLNNLGMDNILTKKFVLYDNKKNSYLKHAILIRFISGILCIVLINFLGFFIVNPDYHLLLFILSLNHIAMPFQVYALFFNVEARADLAAIGSIVGLFFGFIYRLFCLYFDLGLIFLAFAYVFEMLVMGGVYIYFFRSCRESIKNSVFSADRAKRLLFESAPLMLTGAVTLLYMKVDQVMLGVMSSDITVGVYVSATRLTEACWFLGLAVIGVYFPKILQAKKEVGDDMYYKHIVEYGRWLVWLGIVVVCMVYLFGAHLILFLYGDDYLRSVNVLIITIITVPFIYLGGISTKMFVVDGALSLVLVRGVFGLLINVLLNLLLIPIYDELGAAISLLVSQICVCYLFNIMSKDKSVFKTQTRVILGWVNKGLST